MKWADLKNKNTAELEEILASKRAELYNLRFQAQSHQLKQVHKIREVRRTITRLNLLLQQRKREKEEHAATSKAPADK